MATTRSPARAAAHYLADLPAHATRVLELVRIGEPPQDVHPIRVIDGTAPGTVEVRTGRLGVRLAAANVSAVSAVQICLVMVLPV